MSEKNLKNVMLKSCHQLYKFFSGSYNLLLTLLVLLLAFRPINRGFFYVATWELCFAAVFFVAIFIVPHPKAVTQAAKIIGIPALLFNWAGLYTSSHWLVVPGIVLTITFLLISTGSVFFREIWVSKGSWKSLTPVICAYFLIGFAFAYGFVLIEYIYPGSLKIINPDPRYFGHGEYLSQAVAMSFSSLLALNALDPATPSSMQTMMLTEGLLSQFYLAALTSRIVSIYRASRKEQQQKQGETKPQIEKT